MSFDIYFEKITSLCGGRAALAAYLGVGASALSNYAKRGTMPARKQALLDKLVDDKGMHWDEATLCFMPLASKKAGLKPICLLIITGGIAAYKALELARRLMDEGYVVRGVMTASAQQFITPLSLAALTGEAVYTELFSLTDEQEMGHIRLAREADIVVVAPATGNFIAKIATGLADDLATTLCLASDSPLYFAPAMNPVMWAQPATQENCAKLRMRGAVQIGPATGDTACGEIGEGRFAAVPDIISCLPSLDALNQGARPLYGKHIIITAGPTREPIDGVRYISNHSSGKQGYAIARACRDAGADVTLISGPTDLDPPKDVRFLSVMTAREMYEASLSCLPADVAICTAAVADWHVVDASHQKLKKSATNEPPEIALSENPDILKAISHHEARPDLVIGFAAETDNLIPAAIAKRHKKGCDWIMANHISKTESVFGADYNQLVLIREGEETTWPAASKQELATSLISEISSYFTKG